MPVGQVDGAGPLLHSACEAALEFEPGFSNSVQVLVGYLAVCVELGHRVLNNSVAGIGVLWGWYWILDSSQQVWFYKVYRALALRVYYVVYLVLLGFDAIGKGNRGEGHPRVDNYRVVCVKSLYILSICLSDAWSQFKNHVLVVALLPGMGGDPVPGLVVTLGQQLVETLVPLDAGGPLLGLHN